MRSVLYVSRILKGEMPSVASHVDTYSTHAVIETTAGQGHVRRGSPHALTAEDVEMLLPSSGSLDQPESPQRIPFSQQLILAGSQNLNKKYIMTLNLAVFVNLPATPFTQEHP